MLDLPDDARILDPACGSGVFLVDAFRRLVWKKKVTLERELTHEDILYILINQIYGVDVEPGAVEVTAFSLYLALLELDESFNNQKDVKFPTLIYNPEKWDEDYPPTLYKQDICNTEHIFNENEPFKKLKFDLIVGNPPWTELGEKTAPLDPENPESGKQWSYEYIKENNIPSSNPDQAIMVRVRDFARPDTRIAFIVASRLFYQSGIWLNSFLKDNCIYMAINLTDMANEKILFGGKGTSSNSPVMPGSVIFYNPQPHKENSTVTYICPKWYPAINRREGIIIHPPDIQIISLSLLQDYPYLWKIAFRGSQRDFELIRKLTQYPYLSLRDFLHKIGIDDKKYCRGYIIGNKKNDATKYIGWPNLESDKDYKYLIRSNELPKFPKDKGYERLEAPRDECVYKAPLLIFRRSVKHGETRVAFTPEDTMYSTSYIGISFNGADEHYAHRLNAIFNSKFALYLAFMLSRELGWFKRVIDDRDWFNLPLPRSILDLADERWEKVCEIENYLVNNWNDVMQHTNQALNSTEISEIKDKENDLFNCVCDLYELNENERIIVGDTINYTLNHFLNRRKSIPLRSTQHPTLDKLQKYADRLCKQLNGMLALEGKKLIYQLYEIDGDKSSLTVVEFEQISKTTAKVTKPKKVGELEDALIDLSQNIKREIVGGIYALIHPRVYDRERLYMIKPSEERFWSESAALNDADEIIRDHMGGQYDTS
jgi:hypothetical protein